MAAAAAPVVPAAPAPVASVPWTDAAGELVETDVRVWAHDFKCSNVRTHDISPGYKQRLMDILKQPNTTRKRMQEKVRVILQLFYSWPSACREIQGELLREYQDVQKAKTRKRHAKNCRVKRRIAKQRAPAAAGH